VSVIFNVIFKGISGCERLIWPHPELKGRLSDVLCFVTAKILEAEFTEM
jgi:hypothetical protein